MLVAAGTTHDPRARSAATTPMNTLARSLTRLRRIWRRGGKAAFARMVFGPLLPTSYRAWIIRNEPSEARLTQQRAQARHLTHRPLLTCVVVGDPPHGQTPLDASIRSMIHQTYDHWNLWVGRASVEHAGARRLAEDWAARDPRVRLHCEPPTLHSAGAGEFVMPVTAGDRLSPDALFEAARVLNEHPGTDILYWDEDSLSPDGRRRSSPFFKPGWSPELLLSVNYLAHAMFKRSLIENADVTVESCGNTWDVALRCSERAREIRHLPRVLYHRRTAAPQTPLPSDLRALEAHGRRLGLADPHAFVTPRGAVRLIWPPRDHRVSIVVPNRDHVRLLERCLTTVLTRTRYPDLEILLVDTGSTDQATHDYYQRVRADRRIRVIDRPGPFNFSAANNAGVRAATGDLLLFLNNDTEVVHEDWLEEMVRWSERPEIGAVGAKLLYPDDTIQHAGMIIGLRGLAHHIFWQAAERQSSLFGSVDWYRNYLAVTGACMMMRRDVFDLVGGFDETYRVAYSDVEMCLRLVRRGYRVVYTPFATLRHHEGATRGAYYPPADSRKALRDAHDILMGGDPYFHPALSCESLVPALPRIWDRSREALVRKLVRAAATDANAQAG